MLRLIARVTVVAVLSAVPLFGQGGNAAFNGSVVDQSGAVLPGVTVTASEESTGIVRTVVSNEVGRFVLPAVMPGRYRLSAELAGFQTQARAGITIGVGQDLTINFTLPVGSLSDQVTVTGESPLVEVTQTVIGANMSQTEIESLPLAGRQQYGLMQLVPGLTPNLNPGTFQGTQYAANGRDSGGNLFLLDGAFNNDDRSRSGGGSQGQVTLDSTAEFQVLTHEYGVEYGGAAGVIVNAVSRSGTNEFHGRGFYYYQDESLNATNYFLKIAGRENPDSGNKAAGGNIGGPILRNKAFFFFNYERNGYDFAANLNFPAEAAPLAVSYSTTTIVRVTNYFARLDYQLNPSHGLSYRMVHGPNTSIGDSLEPNKSTIENARWETDPFEGLSNFQWTAVLSNRMVNEARFVRTGEDTFVGTRSLFPGTGKDDFENVSIVEDGEYIALQGRDQMDIGSQQSHPDYRAGPDSSPGGGMQKVYTFTELFTYTPGSHTMKFGFGASKNGGTAVRGADYFGNFTFAANPPFDPAVAGTYPTRFAIRFGEILIPDPDHRYNFFVSDKWQITNQLTLSMGVRYDYQNIVSNTKDGFAPRFGMAYSPNDRTVIRAGIGKFYEHQSTNTASNLYAGQVISPAFVFDTGEDTSSLRGVLPTHTCLRADGDGEGRAKISAACRAQMEDIRRQVEAGGFVNTEPVVDGNRKLGYLLGFSAGIQREIVPGLGLTVDFVGTRGRDQTVRIDINEPRFLPNGTYGRPGVAVFDPDGTLIPAEARGANFQRVLQYQTSGLFDTDYNAFELSLERRMANRWSGRMSYTLSRSRDIGSNVETRVVDDLNPRMDYALSNVNNKHAFATGGNWDAWRGLSAGATFRYYSGNPVTETVGLDKNLDRDNTDRPVQGIDDLTMPILSPVDANGVAIRNGIPGENRIYLDLRLQYVHTLRAAQTLGFFWEIYNATNRVNFGNVVGNRRSADFGKSIVASDPRAMQLGLRYTF